MYNPGIIGGQPATITMDQILNMYSSAFLDKILFMSVLYLLFSLFVWWNMKKLNIETTTGRRFFRIYLYLNVVASLYFPILMLGYKTGWFI